MLKAIPVIIPLKIITDKRLIKLSKELPNRKKANVELNSFYAQQLQLYENSHSDAR